MIVLGDKAQYVTALLQFGQDGRQGFENQPRGGNVTVVTLVTHLKGLRLNGLKWERTGFLQRST